MNPPSNPHPVIPPILHDDEFNELAALDSCSVANAIERFNIQLRNEGFTEGGLVCRFPHFPPMLGYAFTLQVRSSTPPSKGRAYFENRAWWDALLSLPQPRILVVQDLDRQAGVGAVVGEVHAEILKALGCIGVVTNGAVRDLQEVETLGFHMYSGALSVSHSYSHIVHVGGCIQIGGLELCTGDLIHGDRHGIVRVPKELASRIVKTAAALRQKEQEIIAYCRSPEFTVEGLRSLLDGQ
ncbi:MAG: RraA family protein [Methylacidiphilales bacterium]|nr:RraA family protein [Candidatus Methylacidiphilales bacterium]